MKKKKPETLSTHDKFIQVMSDFVTVAAYNFAELDELMVEMRKKVNMFLILRVRFGDVVCVVRLYFHVTKA